MRPAPETRPAGAAPGWRALLAGACLAGAWFAMAGTTPANGLEHREAQQVVAILEALHRETGRTVYFDEEAAGEWFEVDEESSRRITGAGFTSDGWKRAFDDTLTGFIAAVPEAEFDRLFDVFEEQLAALAHLSEEERQAARRVWQEQKVELRAIRAQGAAHIGAVQPYVARLKKLAFGP